MSQAGGFPRRRRRTFQLDAGCPDRAVPQVRKQQQQILCYLLPPKQQRASGGRETMGRLQPLFGDGKASSHSSHPIGHLEQGMTLDKNDVARCALQGCLDSPEILVADTALLLRICKAIGPIRSQICPMSLMESFTLLLKHKHLLTRGNKEKKKGSDVPLILS